MIEQPAIPHGPIKVLFTCDEEIGHGVDHVDLERLGAHVAYTLDGGGAGEIDVETFSADLATVTVRGVNIHPSIAKGRMVNAVRAAAVLVDRLPRQTLAPETTDGRDGFLHPYHVEGGVAQVTLRILLRDFRTAALADQAERIRQVAAAVERDFPGVAIDVNVRAQYRNLGDGLQAEPRAVAFAEEAFRRLGATLQTSVHSRRHRRFAAHRPRTPHAQPVDRPALAPFAPGMGLPGRNGTSRRRPRATGPGLGGTVGISLRAVCKRRR